MTTDTLAPPVARSVITLPPIGTLLEAHGGELAAIQRAKPGSSQADYAIIIPRGAAFEVRDVAWGGGGHELPGTTCMWDGLVNTEALLASPHKHPVADALRQMREATGMADLYLPSLRELKALFANGCTEFDANRWYWSSIQYSRDTAFGQYFHDGSTGLLSKDWDGGAARFARRIPLSSFAGDWLSQGEEA
jgi:hypothetical protein